MWPPFGMNSINFISSSDGMPLLIRWRSCRTCAPRSVASSRSWWVKNCAPGTCRNASLIIPRNISITGGGPYTVP
jgi:hypothetical protein